MATGECVCGEDFGQLGLLTCSKVAKLQVRDNFVPTYGEGGVRNGISTGDLVDQGDGSFKIPESYIIGKLDSSESIGRWNITPKMFDNITPSSTDDTDYTTSLGEIINLRNGVQAISYELPSVPYGLASRIKNNCTEMSTFPITETGQILGEISDDRTMIYPLKIQKGSIKSKNNPATVDKPFYVSVSYQLSRLADESKFILIGSDEIVPDMTEALSSVSAVITQSTTSNTDINLFVKVTSDFEGNFGGLTGLTGLDTIADWTVDNAGSPIVPSSIVEVDGEVGEYKIIIASTASTALSVSYLKNRLLVTDYAFIAPSVTITSGTA